MDEKELIGKYCGCGELFSEKFDTYSENYVCGVHGDLCKTCLEKKKLIKDGFKAGQESGFELEQQAIVDCHEVVCKAKIEAQQDTARKIFDEIEALPRCMKTRVETWHIAKKDIDELKLKRGVKLE